jgi:ABC-type Fe3+-hydroxamate transport system substrate-binding protein
MKREAPVRTPAAEIRRQIGFTEALKVRAYKKADEKASQYDAKIEELKAKLAEVEAADTVSA